MGEYGAVGGIDREKVGVHVYRDGSGHWCATFGIYLPGITSSKGYEVRARIIHERDQFVHKIEPKSFALTPKNDSALDRWGTTVDLTSVRDGNFGEEGSYRYWFQLLRHGKIVTSSFCDPFATRSGTGAQSAFVLDSQSLPFGWSDIGFRVPEVDDLVVYEMHVGEFNGTFDGAAQQIDYLTGLGVNVLELMPFTNIKEDIDWGYTPLGYFAPEDRYGGPEGLKRLVNTCHERGVAVILDAVYAHAHPEFPYNLVYETSGEWNPMMGTFAGEFFSCPGTDYSKEFTRDYFLLVNQYWLDEYHIDGFRYDYVPGMYDGPVGQGYSDLVYRTYRVSQNFGDFRRFEASGYRSRIIQCAEHLPNGPEILSSTYSNTCWQNGLLDEAAAQANQPVRKSFAHQLDPELKGYPNVYSNPVTNEKIPVAPFQYLCSHDNPRLINRFGSDPERDMIGEPYGDRDLFYKTQPYAIAMYTAKGIPMLWEGEEFGENWNVPSFGLGRVLLSRPLHWEYFYDGNGRALVDLYRRLGTLRKGLPALKSRGYFYYYDDYLQRNDGIISFRREAIGANGESTQSVIVMLNFSDHDVDAWVPWPKAGTWVEQIDAQYLHPRPSVSVAHDGQWVPAKIPSNYGGIYLHQ